MEQRAIVGADGARLNVREAGPRDGLPVVFLHGFSLSSVVWERQLAAAATLGCRAIAPDLRGHGGSETGTADLRAVSTWASDLDAVIGGCAVGPPVVVAWSYGGVVLGDYLAAFGDAALRGIVLVAAAPLIDYDPAAADDPFFSLIPPLTGSDTGARHRAEAVFAERLTAAPLDPMAAAAIRDAIPLATPATRLALMERKANHLSAYAGVSAPALLVHGDADVLMPMFVSELVGKSIRGSTLLRYEGIGHAPFLEAPDRFNGDLRAFIQGPVSAFRER